MSIDSVMELLKSFADCKGTAALQASIHLSSAQLAVFPLMRFSFVNVLRVRVQVNDRKGHCYAD